MSQNRKSDCLTSLRNRILALDIAPGTNLDELSLCDNYGLSRTPLREVLRQLAGEGFLTLEANRGAKVASMDFATLRTFFQTAPLVYANMGRLAAENRTAAQLADLKTMQRDFAKVAKGGDAARAAILNHRFHEIIGEMAANPYLMAALGRLLIDHTRLSQTFYRPASPAETILVLKAVDQHDAMIAALEAREPAMMTDLTLQHWDLSRDRMERFVHPDPLPIDVISLKDRRHAL